MPILRSRAVFSKPRPEALEPSPPPPPPSVELPNPARADPPPSSPATFPSAPHSDAEIGPSGAMHPRRRSLRLVSRSISASGSANPVVADSSGKWRTSARAYSSTSEVEGRGIGCKAGAEGRKVEVFEGAEGSSLGDCKKRGSDNAVGGKYMCLRSGAKIARRVFDKMSVDADQVQTEKLVADADRVEEAFGKIIDAGMVAVSLEEITGEERSCSEEKGKGILIVRDTAEPQPMNMNFPEPEGHAEVKSKGEDKAVLEEDCLLVCGSEVDMDANGKTKGKDKLIMEEDCLPVYGSKVDMDAKCKDRGKDKLIVEEDCLPLYGSEVDMDAEGKSKGKGKLVVEEDRLPVHGIEFDMDVDTITMKDDVGHSQNDDALVYKRKPRKAKGRVDSRKEADRTRAMELAPKFAFFKAKEDNSWEEEEGQEEAEDLSPGAGHEDWPGPFSTAMKIIEERNEKLRARESNASVKKDKTAQLRIPWMPSQNSRPLGRPSPTLRDLSMKVLADNIEEIESLDGIPDVLKHRLILMLCHSRKLSSRLLRLLVSGMPTEIRLSDCSWATEGLFEEVFAQCNTECLKVLQLDLCGRCLPDYVVRASLAHYPNSLLSLTTISLKGAYRLSDDGLNAIVSSAPSLSSVNLSQCSLLTSSGIINIVDKLETVLRELYIDDCQNMDAMAILPALKKLIQLEVLSVAGIRSVCDKFVHKIIPNCASHIKELRFAGCQKLTAASIKTISGNCSRLCAIDLRNLNRLNDSAIGCLANGCRSLQKLKLCRNSFSDEAVAAFLEASGGSLTELSLNNVKKVAGQTALAISRRCSSTLYSLDLSFCREMTDHALGLIVDSCTSLRIVKLFGCTQVSEVFFNGHSNPFVKLIGLRGQILDETEIPYFV